MTFCKVDLAEIIATVRGIRQYLTIVLVNCPWFPRGSIIYIPTLPE